MNVTIRKVNREVNFGTYYAESESKIIVQYLYLIKTRRAFVFN